MTRRTVLALAAAAAVLTPQGAESSPAAPTVPAGTERPAPAAAKAVARKWARRHITGETRVYSISGFVSRYDARWAQVSGFVHLREGYEGSASTEMPWSTWLRKTRDGWKVRYSKYPSDYAAPKGAKVPPDMDSTLPAEH